MLIVSTKKKMMRMMKTITKVMLMMFTGVAGKLGLSFIFDPGAERGPRLMGRSQEIRTAMRIMMIMMIMTIGMIMMVMVMVAKMVMVIMMMLVMVMTMMEDVRWAAQWCPWTVPAGKSPPPPGQQLLRGYLTISHTHTQFQFLTSKPIHTQFQ